jgi:hypothetical protein
VLVPDQTSNGSGDVGRRQPGRRHVIEQRLKEVMVFPVDQGDVQRRLGTSLCDSEGGEAGADDDHARARGVCGAAGRNLKCTLLQGLRRMSGHRSLFTFAGVVSRHPQGEHRVELSGMKYACVRSRCIAGEASEPSCTVEEARCR